VDLHQRRLLAAAQERLAQALFDETTPATDIVTLLEEEALRVQVALRNNTAGRLQWASALLPPVLADVEARRLQRETTGSAVLGVPVGATIACWAASTEGCTCCGSPWHGQNDSGVADSGGATRMCRWWSSQACA
jgi:hypothetical protein